MDAIALEAGLTASLATQSASLRYADLSSDARALARQCVLDYLGCTLAGAEERLTRILLAELEEQGGGGATVIGHPARLPALSAALVNGAASHALDFDDVNMAMPGHPSVAILPGLLALAEERGASGARVLAAFVAGYELQCRLGRAIAPGHYDGLGFHATATVGSFGAAAACAHLLGLDATATATALGIAATQAAGLKSMFGTMCKPLHAGKASYHGLFAARLAARGFSSREDIIECPQGFARTHSADFWPERALASPPRGLWIFDNLFKYHAACYLTHAPIEAARKLKAKPADLAYIRLRIDQATDRVCNIAAPRTGLEAKFSLRLTTAMALAGRDTGALETYSEETAADPELIALRDRITIEFASGWPHTLAEIEVETTSGERLSARHDAGVPAEDIGEQGRRVEEKFQSIAQPLLREGALRVVETVRRFDVLEDVRGLLALCR